MPALLPMPPPAEAEDRLPPPPPPPLAVAPTPVDPPDPPEIMLLKDLDPMLLPAVPGTVAVADAEAAPLSGAGFGLPLDEEKRN